MTRQEAIELEDKVESIFKEYLDEKPIVSMAFTGKLRVEVEHGFVNFTEKGYPDYVKWNWYVDDLENLISVIKTVCQTEYETIRKLKWSYEHQSELTIDGSM